jgi:hypothetical protein
VDALRAQSDPQENPIGESGLRRAATLGRHRFHRIPQRLAGTHHAVGGVKIDGVWVRGPVDPDAPTTEHVIALWPYRDAVAAAFMMVVDGDEMEATDPRWVAWRDNCRALDEEQDARDDAARGWSARSRRDAWLWQRPD